ncbi:MAG: RNA pseudouridine synthase [Porticoccus sp.]
MKFEKHLKIDSTDKTAVDILGESTELTKQAIKQTMSKGAVWLTRHNSTRRIRRADKPLKPGDNLHLYFDQTILEQQPDEAILIADEGLYSIWHKPYGMLCQGSKWGDHYTINRWVEKNLKPQRPAFIVHRLDRAATGLIIIAHQKKIAAYFSNLFQCREMEKKYQAIVYGKFPAELTLTSEIDNKPARSHARSINFNSATNQSLVKIDIETGRKHQIRQHLSKAGFPIVGDRLYGQEEHNGTDGGGKDLCLTSYYLSFISPIDRIKKIYTLPDSLRPKLEH